MVFSGQFSACVSNVMPGGYSPRLYEKTSVGVSKDVSESFEQKPSKMQPSKMQKLKF